MPSPIGHSLMALIVYRAIGKPVAAGQWRHLALYVLAANAPDLDFVPGLLAGELGRYHHGPSHSFSLSICFGVLSSFLFSSRLYAFVTGSSLYLSHVVLDYLIQDPSPPHGVPLFWPFSYEYYMAPFAFFRRFDYASHSAESLFSSIFTWHNLLTVFTEVVLLLPLLIFVVCARSKLQRRAPTRLNSPLLED